MAWQEPKLDYDSSTVPGSTHFNRIEGNIQFLNDKIDAGELYVIPSDNIILAADTERVKGFMLSGGTEQHSAIMKQLRVKLKGVYKLEFEGRINIGENGIFGSKIIFGGQTFLPNTSWSTYTANVLLDEGSVVQLIVQVGNPNAGTGFNFYVRNVRVKGSVVPKMPNLPSNAVLQD